MTDLVSLELKRAALFLGMTPFVAALLSLEIVLFNVVVDVSLFPLETAARVFLISVFVSLIIDLFLACLLSDWRWRLIEDK